jgi:hypothetical protein
MKLRHAVVPVAVALVLTGCGDDKKSQTTADESTSLPDGTYSGHFANVPNAPKGTKKITGMAEMVLSATGTKVTLTASGLDPKAVYVAHVHNDLCSAAEPGGAHYKYSPDGGDEPPNELHLMVTVDKKGKGTASTTNPVKAGPSAKSVVIHLKRPAGAKADEAKPPKLACADLAAS